MTLNVSVKEFLGFFFQLFYLFIYFFFALGLTPPTGKIKKRSNDFEWKQHLLPPIIVFVAILVALLVLLKYRLSKVQNQLQKQASGKSDTTKNESQSSKRNSNEGNEENNYEELNITDIVSKHQKQEMGENHYQSLNFSSNSKDSKNASKRKEKSLTD